MVILDEEMNFKTKYKNISLLYGTSTYGLVEMLIPSFHADKTPYSYAHNVRLPLLDDFCKIICRILLKKINNKRTLDALLAFT